MIQICYVEQYTNYVVPIIQIELRCGIIVNKGKGVR